MENRKFSYDKPTQVKFLDIDAEDIVFWQGGIAYGSEIICGCCGGIFDIADIWADWEQVKNNSLYEGIDSPIIEYDYWADLCEAILSE